MFYYVIFLATYLVDVCWQL